jgi:hypothetical protein
VTLLYRRSQNRELRSRDREKGESLARANFTREMNQRAHCGLLNRCFRI